MLSKYSIDSQRKKDFVFVFFELVPDPAVDSHPEDRISKVHLPHLGAERLVQNLICLLRDLATELTQYRAVKIVTHDVIVACSDLKTRSEGVEVLGDVS